MAEEMPSQTPRGEIALLSAWEIEGLAQMVHDQIEDHQDGLPLRSMLRRIVRLAGLQTSALMDGNDDVDSIKARFQE